MLWMFLVVPLLHPPQVNSQWLTKESAQWAINEFERLEAERSQIRFRGIDRRIATPFITGDGFRDYCSPHACEESNRCRMDPLAVKGEENMLSFVSDHLPSNSTSSL